MSDILARAFPLGLRLPLATLLDDLPPATLGPSGLITRSSKRAWPDLSVRGEQVEIPYRIYNDVPPTPFAPPGSNLDVAIACLYTRHHDGHVRQESLRRVLASGRFWTIPFVLQLLGE